VSETKAELRAERDHWKALAEKGLEPRIRQLRFGDGEFSMEVLGEVVEGIAVALVSQFKAGGATNFYEMNLFDRDEPFQRYTVTVQKVGALTPADKLSAAEKRIAELEAMLPNNQGNPKAGRT
jgi:hypothetical protein